MKRLFALALAVILLGAAGGWFALGPEWRTLLVNPPRNANILFWEQEQRDVGFGMLDRLPFLIQSSSVPAGSTPRELPQGSPLELNLDIDTYFEQARHAGVVVLHKGEVRLERYGFYLKPDSRWTSFSVAKSITSSLVGAAIEDGYISSLSDKVSDYIEGLEGSAYDDVTIAQLLTMTSGVAWNEDYDDPNSDVAQFSQHQPTDNLPVIVSYMRSLPRAHAPGQVWNYSTGETNLIGVLVVEATGKQLSDYLSEKIWNPAGMEGDASWLVGQDGQEISGCCIQARLRDFARYGLFMLEGTDNEGTILPAEWINQATKSQVGIGQPGFGYGFQWWTQDDGSFAANGIFGQGIFIDPSRDLVIASNSSWTSARGSEGEAEARWNFYQSVQAAIDAETSGF